MAMLTHYRRQHLNIAQVSVVAEHVWRTSMTVSQTPDAHTSTAVPRYPFSLPDLLFSCSGDIYVGVLRTSHGIGILQASWLVALATILEASMMLPIAGWRRTQAGSACGCSQRPMRVRSRSRRARAAAGTHRPATRYPASGPCQVHVSRCTVDDFRQK